MSEKHKNLGISLYIVVGLGVEYDDLASFDKVSQRTPIPQIIF